jgi:hypothetical protein
MATAEADFDAAPSERLAAERRARYVARVRSQGRTLRRGRDILGSPPDAADAPSDEELLGLLDVIYAARRADV